MAVKTIRRIKPYPSRKKWSGIKRLTVGPIKWPILRQMRPRRHARPWKWKTTFDTEAWKERRAVQRIKGSLPERIFFKALIDWGFIPDQDFTFQANYLGGRQELGGLVADFLFPIPKIIVQIQSVWHTLTLAHLRRDEDQKALLENMGFVVLEIWEGTVTNPTALNDWIMNNLILQWGTSSLGLYPSGASTSQDNKKLHTLLESIEAKVDAILWIFNN